MQKHQYRQHGTIHRKFRSSGQHGATMMTGIIGAESILYMKPGTQPGQQTPRIVFETQHHPQEAENFSEEEEAHSMGTVTKYIIDNTDTDTDTDTLVEIDNNDDHDDPRKSLDMLKYNVQKPMKLKMKLAQAYQKEIMEQREQGEKDRQGGRGDSPGALEHIEENLEDILLSQNITITEVTTDPAPELERKEYLVCMCKLCGSKCTVTDPYNFTCPECGKQWSSSPTSTIVAPLQCMGCLRVFEHKPAMKEHQISEDKVRPFKCCKCLKKFKQKAHLQKHQWRQHRRKLEPDPKVKEAEAILKAVNEMSVIPQPQAPILRITDRGVDTEVMKESVKDMRLGDLESFEGSKPLDLSPNKMYGRVEQGPQVRQVQQVQHPPYSSHCSITAWVQQVETARTPPVPDISILRRPALVQLPAVTAVQLPTEPLPPAQLARDKVSVTIQLLGPAKLPPLAMPSPAQPIAIKSKPPVFKKAVWRSPTLEPRETNPLLNQKLHMEELVLPSVPLQESDIIPDWREGVYKRSKKDLDVPQVAPADLSLPHQLDSPPLNLSFSRLEDAPHDYTLSRSQLITGQFRRIQNQDERGGRAT